MLGLTDNSVCPAPETMGIKSGCEVAPTVANFDGVAISLSCCVEPDKVGLFESFMVTCLSNTYCCVCCPPPGPVDIMYRFSMGASCWLWTLVTLFVSDEFEQLGTWDKVLELLVTIEFAPETVMVNSLFDEDAAMLTPGSKTLTKVGAEVVGVEDADDTLSE